VIIVAVFDVAVVVVGVEIVVVEVELIDDHIHFGMYHQLDFGY